MALQGSTTSREDCSGTFQDCGGPGTDRTGSECARAQDHDIHMQGTLTTLAEDEGTPVFSTSVNQIFIYVKSMIMETWKTQRELKRQLLANSQVQVPWDAANDMPESEMDSGPTPSETSNQGQTSEMITMMSRRLQNLTQESKRKADIEEARFGLDKEERDKNSMFTIKAAHEVPMGMKPQSFKSAFPPSIGSITSQALTRFIEILFVFTETISEHAREINEFVLKLTKHCYSRESETVRAGQHPDRPLNLL
jgi:hypothetical protein